MKAKINVRKDAHGYAYEITVNGRVVAQGWSAGTKRECIEAAKALNAHLFSNQERR